MEMFLRFFQAKLMVVEELDKVKCIISNEDVSSLLPSEVDEIIIKKWKKMLTEICSQILPRMANFYDDNLSQINVSNEEKDKLVADVIRYVLFKYHQNSGCPIKRDELTHLVNKNYNQRTLPTFVINEARVKLSTIFGYEMRELQRSRPSSSKPGHSQQGVSDAKSYVIISQVPAEIYRKYIEDRNSSHITGFAFTVISIVHLAGGKISEENIWHHLRRLDLNETEENHPVFGSIKQNLEILVQQRYLQRNKFNGPEGNGVIYELAERALDESISQGLKDYVAQIGKKDVASLEI